MKSRKESELLFICLLVLFLLSILILISSKDQKEFFQSLNSKEHPLRFLYCTISFWRHKLLKKEENSSLSERLLSYKKGASVIFCLMIVSTMVLIYELKEYSKPSLIVNNEIQRLSFGEGNQKVSAIYHTELGQETLDIIVSEKGLEGKPLIDFLNRCFLLLDSLILGENASYNEITSDLNLLSTIPGTSVSVTYEILNLDYIKRSGKIKFENINEEGCKVKIVAQLNYEGVKQTKEYDFLIYPKEIVENERIRETIEQQILSNEEETINEDQLKLPTKVLDYSIAWTENKNSTSFVLFFIGVTLSFLLPVLQEQKMKEKEENRKQQMRKDYPEIVSKFQLLLVSGMTTKGAWERIANDYLLKKEEMNQRLNKSRKWKKLKRQKQYERFAYEEMLITKREHEIGITESVSFERFGKRCKQISYIRFSSLLSQNLRMGSHGISQLLEQEARSAFQERKEIAKQLGEKASTKLLLPTMGMLVVIIGIIMVPAVLNF